jgi:endo-1,4-beta-D-glucanase Y
MPMSRRSALCLAAAGAAGPAAPALAQVAAGPAQARLPEVWNQFRSRFMAPEGRIVDTGNQNISHSEGQSYGMMLAVSANDRANFDRLWNWTRRNLRRPRDHLSAWRWKPNTQQPVEDLNNATDGDLMIAWALLKAADAWNVPEYREQAVAIGRDILRLVVRSTGGMTVLLPGARGFERRESVTINPSYYCFPAIRALAGAVPDPAWVRIAADGLQILRAARFGRWNLPPDWLTLSRGDRRLSLPDNWAPRFSYDAVRVPLFLGWAGLGQEPAVQSAAIFWADPSHQRLPAWTDFSSNAVSPYGASPGIAAIAAFSAAVSGRGLRTPANQPEGDPMPDYYSAVLTALVSLARRDSGADFW